MKEYNRMDSRLFQIDNISITIISKPELASCDSADKFLITYFTLMSFSIKQKLQLDGYIPLPGNWTSQWWRCSSERQQTFNEIWLKARLKFRPQFNSGFSQDVSITSLNICHISLFTVTLLQRKNEWVSIN